MLGRILNGSGMPIDGGPKIIPDEKMEIIGSAINPGLETAPESSFKQVSPPSMVF